MSAITGAAGLMPTYQALVSGKNVALANKETLVMAGQLMMEKAREKSVTILPVDSEHNAIHQCLRGARQAEVRRLILTASGGPFRDTPKGEFIRVTREEALNHPTWRMGKKVTIDSATMMNKGLEVIEASWFFSLPPERVEVAVHPQSIVHSMVEFIDGSILAQIGLTDMRIPIQYALTYPERWPSPLPPLEIKMLANLEFFEPDRDKFECLDLAYEAAHILCQVAPARLDHNLQPRALFYLYLQVSLFFPDLETEILQGELGRQTGAESLKTPLFPYHGLEGTGLDLRHHLPDLAVHLQSCLKSVLLLNLHEPQTIYSCVGALEV